MLCWFINVIHALSLNLILTLQTKFERGLYLSHSVALSVFELVCWYNTVLVVKLSTSALRKSLN